ncbi:putative phosphoglycerate mutase [Streptoalloteichus tenebrarius]|uniref:Phosphoglycerate mutase n=1 Tax=Streptoalloteichus tenebrarius (strain ATCC 17920 / DSM 40477 / JCM 4838 / CBS 697.72 / NBRC 16177 / NCIMB 11028 / NRRL B-12390 / A12253. 1 / ISP 5477) TaxID=1933 RepID=A0ABT1I4H7_STRSD|nr:histidine phosphatase family protein [Streptoalloteichus tenebrarius]MCP2262645.1 putative phosphoglycerate mutase [Streptoalloteichus tenebrarius]BFF01826.1 histidine phosphatase family protein [Streptoalloteichus tenebrarius]
MSTPRLVLVRHGQSEANVLRYLDTRPPGAPLTAEGRAQAEDLASDLADEPVVAVYASRALRAQQTAAPLAARHGLAVGVLDGVHEVQAGDLEGRNEAGALQRYEDVFALWSERHELDVPMPGGESARQVLDRFLPDARRARAEHPDGTVVLVSHGTAIRLCAPHLVGNPDFLAGLVYLPNTGRIVLETDGDDWRCVEWTGMRLA